MGSLQPTWNLCWMFTKSPMKGYLFINDDGWDLDADLSFWIEKCLAFNPKAKASKKKK